LPHSKESLEWEKTKLEFEAAESIHNNWLNYTKKHNFDKDIKAIYRLLDSSQIARSDEEILDILYDAALAVLDSTPQLDSELKTRTLYRFSCNLCTCEECQKEAGAHTNRKGQIRISKKYFDAALNQEAPPPIGLLEIMYTIVHHLLHGIFAELDETAINKKTEEVWKSGITELANEK
jgi:HrpA-like RNA helicase